MTAKHLKALASRPADRARAILSRHSARTWLLWLVGVAVLGTAAAGLGDPGLWLLVFDPELVAVTVLLGVALIRENGRVMMIYVVARARSLFVRR